MNTLTNAMFVYLALVGISSCIRNKHPRVFLMAYISYMVIGVTSLMFHASLKCSLPLERLTHWMLSN